MKPEIRRLFDEPLDRTGTFCSKWDAREKYFHSSTALPMWVADMDFRTPKTVIDAMCQRAMHGAFGYEAHNPARAQAVKGWMKRRHGLDIEENWLLESPGVVDSLHMCVAALTQPGDMVLINTPVYGPFYSSVTQEDRKLYECAMKLENGRYIMDLEKIEAGFQAGGKMFLLCNPHNPVGRVWTKQEMADLAGLCEKYGAWLVSDEIHSDFIRAGYTHTCALSVASKCVQLNSATKTFNLAALRQSEIICPHENAREQLRSQLSRRGAGGNLMGAVAQEAAYRTGDQWVDGLNEYLDESREKMERFVEEHMPGFRLIHSEGTYLLWLDATCTGLTGEALTQAFVDKAGVALSGGEGFGKEGAGHLRINIATTHANIARAMEGMKKGFGK